MSVFDTQVSIFDTISSNSRSELLSSWLSSQSVLTHPKHIETVKLVLRIRETTDIAEQKRLKKHLPGIVTACHIKPGHARLHEHIETLTGWMQFDIDPAGNETIGDWDAIRDGLLNTLEYVAFASLSVRGSGVWGLVKVSNPERLADHQKQLIHDMRNKYSINLDASKGGNPTDLRFFSHDPNARMKPDFKIYNRLPQVLVHRRPKPNSAPDDVFKFAYNAVVKNWNMSEHSPFKDKGYHYSIYRLCCMLNRLGVSQREAESYIDTHIFPLDEITSNCITDPYSRFAHEHGVWSQDRPKAKRSRNK